MKLLIVSLPRTGSSELLYRLCDAHNLKNIYEPFDKTGLSEYISGEDNVGVKSLIYDKTDLYENNIDFYVELAKEFDQIILLTRKDLNQCAESWAYYRHIKDTTGEATMQAYKWYPTDNFIHCYNNILQWDKELRILSDRLNIGLTYYEDIFDVNSKERYRTNI